MFSTFFDDISQYTTGVPIIFKSLFYLKNMTHSHLFQSRLFFFSWSVLRGPRTHHTLKHQDATFLLDFVKKKTRNSPECTIVLVNGPSDHITTAKLSSFLAALSTSRLSEVCCRLWTSAHLRTGRSRLPPAFPEAPPPHGVIRLTSDFINKQTKLRGKQVYGYPSKAPMWAIST